MQDALTPLLLAARGGYENVVNSLLANGANLEAADKVLEHLLMARAVCTDF